MLTSCLRAQNSTAFSVERLDGHVRFHPTSSPFLRHQDFSSAPQWEPERDSHLKGLQRRASSSVQKRIDAAQESPPSSRSSATPDTSGATSYSSRFRNENQAVEIQDATSASCSVFSTKLKKLTAVVKDALSRVSCQPSQSQSHETNERYTYRQGRFRCVSNKHAASAQLAHQSSSEKGAVKTEDTTSSGEKVVVKATHTPLADAGPVPVGSCGPGFDSTSTESLRLPAITQAEDNGEDHHNEPESAQPEEEWNAEQVAAWLVMYVTQNGAVSVEDCEAEMHESARAALVKVGGLRSLCGRHSKRLLIYRKGRISLRDPLDNVTSSSPVTPNKSTEKQERAESGPTQSTQHSIGTASSSACELTAAPPLNMLDLPPARGLPFAPRGALILSCAPARTLAAQWDENSSLTPAAGPMALSLASTPTVADGADSWT